MNKQKLLIVLAAVSALLAVVSILLLRDDSVPKKAVSHQEFLFPSLARQMDQLDRVEIRYRDGEQYPSITLVKDNGRWLVREKYFYPADQQRLTHLFNTLNQRKLAAAKTREPSYFDRLGVADPERSGLVNPGVRISLYAENETLGDVIVGLQEERSGANYIRRFNGNRSWVLDGSINVSTTLNDWVSTRVINIEADQIRQIFIRHEANPVSIYRTEQEQPFSIRGVDVKSNLKYAGLEQASRALENLHYTDLVLSETVLVSSLDVQVDYELWNGLVLELQGVRLGQRNLISLKAINFLTEDNEQFEQVQQEAERLNLAWSRWVYEISANDYKKFANRLSDFIDSESTQAATKSSAERQSASQSVNKQPLAPIETISLEPVILPTMDAPEPEPNTGLIMGKPLLPVDQHLLKQAMQEMEDEPQKSSE